MPSKFRLRKPFSPIVKFLAKGFIKLKVTPNIATLLMLSMSVVSALFLILLDNILLFGIFVFITGLMDGVDGAIARLTNSQSPFGGFFDSLMDRISEMIIYSSFIISSQRFIFSEFVVVPIIVFIMLSSYMISYTRARFEVIGQSKGIKYDTNIGLFARSERLFYIFLVSVISYIIDPQIFIFFSWSMLIFMFLTAGTFLFRIVKYKQYLEGKK